MSFSVKIFGEELELENSYNINFAVKKIQEILGDIVCRGKNPEWYSDEKIDDKLEEKKNAVLKLGKRNKSKYSENKYFSKKDFLFMCDSGEKMGKIQAFSIISIDARKGYQWCPFRKDFIFAWIRLDPEEAKNKCSTYFKCRNCHKIYFNGPAYDGLHEIEDVDPTDRLQYKMQRKVHYGSLLHKENRKARIHYIYKTKSKDLVKNIMYLEDVNGQFKYFFIILSINNKFY